MSLSLNFEPVLKVGYEILYWLLPIFIPSGIALGYKIVKTLITLCSSLFDR